MSTATKRRPTQQPDLAPPSPADHMRCALDLARIGTEHARASLIRDMRQMEEDLRRAIFRLQRGIAPNALGELQGTATMIDAKCGNLAAQQEAYERLTMLASHLGLLAPVEEV